jgi:hypothetical protein
MAGGPKQQPPENSTTKMSSSRVSWALRTIGIIFETKILAARAGAVTMAAMLALAAAAACAQAAAPYNDFHYPTEEPAEMAGVSVPAACVDADGWSVVFAGPPVCVLEQSFKQWGLMALLGAKNKSDVRILRKSVGLLDGIVQPRRNFSASYFERMAASLADYPAELALAEEDAGADGELSFGALAQQLAPPRDITEISLGSDVVKFVVSHSGRVKCSKTDITEVQNLSAPLPLSQRVVFDPADHLKKAKWPSYDFENMKSGLVGSHLRISNVGAYSVGGGGFEMVALADASFHAPRSGKTTQRRSARSSANNTRVPCAFSAAMNNTYIVGCPGRGCTAFDSLAVAEAACRSTADCGGVTFSYGRYQLRACGPTGASGIGERSYVIVNADACGKDCYPRLPNINYSPAVFVRLREQVPTAAATEPVTPASFHYWRADNHTGAVEVSAAQFWTNFLAMLSFTDSTFDDHAPELRLPGAEGRRQRDQALSGLLLASNNYVGNQANYGDGIPYWSVATQDNGSLALIPTTVDDALLDYGLCETALDHIGFWLTNYLTADGKIIYYTWGGVVDGVGDIGRLASLYIKARTQCGGCDLIAAGETTNGTCAWDEQYMPVLRVLGTRMLVLKANGTDGRPASAQRGPRRPECTGLVAGCPEADWSHFTLAHSPDNETWYSVNLWLQRGMQEIGRLLPTDDALGEQLRGNASLFRTQLQASIAASLVPANSSGFTHPLLLPPYARARGEFAVFHNMTTDVRPPIEQHDLASYSNFRFFAEMLLADTLPREIEAALLTWHRVMGGRLGGASRFMDHLDDFPSAAWGYAALTNNMTEDFIALLYGHAATYSSRGTFHATEQLRFESDGDAYRNYSRTYKGDVSLCVPTAVEVSRLTRWQLIFEPFRTSDSDGPSGEQQQHEVWLARGAPKRWFRDPDGFGMGSSEKPVPLRDGSRIAYHVITYPATRSATYNVNVTVLARLAGAGALSLKGDGIEGRSSSTRYLLRWPGILQKESIVAQGCTIVQTEVDSGLVVVALTVGSGAGPGDQAMASFSVSGQWKAPATSSASLDGSTVAA